jgi:hypothetical protein
MGLRGRPPWPKSISSETGRRVMGYVGMRHARSFIGDGTVAHTPAERRGILESNHIAKSKRRIEIVVKQPRELLFAMTVPWKRAVKPPQVEVAETLARPCPPAYIPGDI